MFLQGMDLRKKNPEGKIQSCTFDKYQMGRCRSGQYKHHRRLLRRQKNPVGHEVLQKDELSKKNPDSHV